jgi:hypothetical protein
MVSSARGVVARFRVVGRDANGPGPFPTAAPQPTTPVLADGPSNTYDANGNWILHVERVGGPSSPVLVGFTHVENHHFNCSGPYAEWNAGAARSLVIDRGHKSRLQDFHRAHTAMRPCVD